MRACGLKSNGARAWTEEKRDRKQGGREEEKRASKREREMETGKKTARDKCVSRHALSHAVIPLARCPMARETRTQPSRENNLITGNHTRNQNYRTGAILRIRRRRRDIRVAAQKIRRGIPSAWQTRLYPRLCAHAELHHILCVYLYCPGKLSDRTSTASAKRRSALREIYKYIMCAIFSACAKPT